MDQPIYITYSEELRKALAKADVDIAQKIREELAASQIPAEVKPAPDPTSANSEDRDVFLLILAGGVAATLVGSAVARVIDAITHQQHARLEEHSLEVALDGAGHPIRDRFGNPVYNASSTPAPLPVPGEERTSLSAGKLLKFDFSR